MIETAQISDKKVAKDPSSFASPFGQDESEPLTPTNQSQGYESPQKP